MNAILQVILALLAAVGLLALGWMLYGKLVTPVGELGPVYAVLPADGDGARLEQEVKGLLWLRSGALARAIIVIADTGLTPEGRAVAAALMKDATGVVLCPAERLGEYLAQVGAKTIRQTPPGVI